MWSPLVRHGVIPLHEWLLGRHTLRALRKLEDSQWWSPDELRTWQAEKLRSLLQHAHRNVPFYRSRIINDYGSTPAENILASLPLLDKDEIREAGTAITWAHAPGGLFPHDTGGSTGRPLRFFTDRCRQASDQSARARTHRWFGVDLGERELLLWGSPIELRATDRLKRFRDRMFNQLLLNAFDMSAKKMDEFLDAWDRFRPMCLFGYPSSVALLADHARNTGRRVDRRLRAVFVTGEVCDSPLRANLMDRFGVPVADGYGSRDAGFIAHECPKGRMHIMAEHVIVEVIRNGLPAVVGEEGEIVVTHLNAYAMPFIRYQTGDVGRLLPGRCTCGRGLPMMDVVQGRTTDFLRLPDGTVKHALSIIYPLRAMAGVRQFRVVQAPDFGVTVSVVAESRDSELANRVQRAVRPVLGSGVKTKVELVESIAAHPSGKYRYVESQVGSRKAEKSTCWATGPRRAEGEWAARHRSSPNTNASGEVRGSDRICLSLETDNARWNDYVYAHQDGTLFHLSGWRDAVAASFGHVSFYLAALEAERIVGVLPLFLVRSRLAGKLLVSVPYGVGGGILSDHDRATAELWAGARRIAEEEEVRRVELRSERAVVANLPVNRDYVGFRKELPHQSEEVLEWLPRKARAVVRQARDRSGLTAATGDEYLHRVWRLYSLNMRRLGSINYPRSFLERLLQATPMQHWTTIVRDGKHDVAGLVTFLFRDRVMPYFFGCTPRARRCGAAHFAYFHVMQRAVEQGYRVFDFGRSRRDNAGSCDFKRFQGFLPQALEYQSYVPSNQKPVDLSPHNARWALARSLWTWLPLCITRPGGAWLSRHIPG